MKASSGLYLGLIHHPVVNKNGDTIASAVTNLDLHDIARAARTYGVRAFYVVTPLEDQLKLVGRIIGHWTEGAGGDYNPARRAALEIIRIMPDYPAVLADIEAETGEKPLTVVTSARPGEGAVSYPKLREIIDTGKKPCIVNFGTAWGLSQEFMAAADYTLEPIRARSDYNHLSVRSAVSIILDRLLSDDR